MIKFSVITVCYNVKNKLECTISNILQQKYDNFEIVIVDGNSSDGTDRLLEGFRTDKRFSIIREPDRGLYDAMNKGIRESTGDFIIFMNAGDVFDNPNVLLEISESISIQNKIIYYGTSKAVYPTGQIRSNRILVRKYKNFLYDVFEEKMPNHQAIAASRDCFRDNLFQEKYPICADFCWIARCVKRHVKVQEMKVCVARFEVGGTSSRPSSRAKMQREREAILLHEFPVRYRVYKFMNPR